MKQQWMRVGALAAMVMAQLLMSQPLLAQLVQVDPVAAKEAAAVIHSPELLPKQPSEQPPMPVPGPSFESTYWELACDNVGFCSAISLPEENTDETFRVRLGRSATPRDGGFVSIKTFDRRNWETLPPERSSPHPRNALSPPGDLYVLGRTGTRALDTEYMVRTETWSIPLEEAASVFSAGDTLVLRRRDGVDLASLSLDGITDMFRIMDDIQKRNGTVTALVNRGNKPVSAMAEEPPTPLFVRRAPVPPLTMAPDQPDALVWESIAQQTGCIDPATGKGHDPEAREAYQLDAEVSLLRLPCGITGNARDYTWFSARLGSSGVEVEPARFDYIDGDKIQGPSEAMVFQNSSFDEHSQMISMYTSGDPDICSEAFSWLWDGQRFRLFSLERKKSCRGDTNLLKVWRAGYVGED